MKKAFILFLLAAAFAGAEEIAPTAEEAVPPANTIALSVGAIGAELVYERAFGTHFSVLGSAAYTNLIFGSEFTVSAKARWYPFGGAFYLDLGAGYMYGAGVVDMMVDMILGVFTFGLYFISQKDKDPLPEQGGLLLQPGLGWKFDPGKRGGIVIPLSAGLDIRLLSENPDFMPTFRAGLGYSF